MQRRFERRRVQQNSAIKEPKSEPPGVITTPNAHPTVALDDRATVNQRATSRSLLFVFVVALGLRAGWGLYRLAAAHDPGALEFPDEVQYWGMARSLWSGTGLHDELGFRATRMPLYPALLAPFTPFEHGVALAKGIQWVVGAVAAVAASLCATALFGRRTGLVSGVLVALDPFLVFFSSLLLTETLSVTALLLLWWTAASLLTHRGSTGPTRRRTWVLFGALAAVNIYLRESSTGLIVLLVGLLVVFDRFRQHTMIGAAISAVIVILALCPWALRNRIVTGDWCFLTHRAGISLYDGVRPGATGASDLGDIKRMEAVRELDEVAWNRYFVTESLKVIEREPGRILRLAGVKLGRMWNPIPNVDSYRSRAVRVIAASWTLPTFALAVAGVILLAVRRGGTGWRLMLFLMLPALYLSALHSLFVGSVRYRLGAIPMIEMLAAFAFVVLISRGKTGSPWNERARDD